MATCLAMLPSLELLHIGFQSPPCHPLLPASIHQARCKSLHGLSVPYSTTLQVHCSSRRKKSAPAILAHVFRYKNRDCLGRSYIEN
ncbi:hypothetical protein BJV74DRAFT_866056 [Russula compacta]|nr:hypothetical protein BJV74DRAFT_866056 [Russula compacta]